MRFRSVAAASLSTALLLGAALPASAQDDAYVLLTQAVSATSTATSLHLDAHLTGTIPMEGTSFPLDAQAVADVSLAPVLLSATVTVPSFMINAGVVIPGDGNAYVKLQLPMASMDDLWHLMPIGDLAVPGPLASSAPVADLAAELRTELDSAGVTLTNEGDASCTAGTCTRLHLEIPPDVLGEGAGTVGVPDMGTLTAPIPVDILVDKASGRIDSITGAISEAASGLSLSLTVALGNYDVPVTVEAPPADQVTDAPLPILEMFGGMIPTP